MKISPLVLGGVALVAFLAFSGSSSATTTPVPPRTGTKPPTRPDLSGSPLPPPPEAFGQMTTLQAQQFLTGLAHFERQPAFDPMGIDGAWGPNTAAALMAYQDSRGLTADGKLGPLTYAEMRKDADLYLGPSTSSTSSASNVIELDQAPSAPSAPSSGYGTSGSRQVMT